MSTLTPISRSVRIWAPDPLVKLFPELGFPAGAPRTVRLEAACGEVVSGQIALRCEGIRFKNHGGVDGCGVDRVDIAPLALAGQHPAAGGIPVEARWVGHTYVPTAAGGVAAERLEGKAPGFYPDPLYPVHQTITNPHHYNPDHSAALVNGRTQGLWLTIRVPRDAVPGEYTGEARLRIAYFGDILRVPIRLRVYAAALALRPSCGVENWFVLASVVRQHECQWFDERFWTLVEAYLRNLADHRETHLVVPMYELIGFLPAAGGGLRLDWAKFDRFVTLALEAGLIFLSGNHLATYTYGTPWYACGVHT